jgi:pimeloyl-ACP methyl ester carboxylesterase
MQRLAVLGQPVLVVLATEVEVMGFGTLLEDIEPYLPPSGRVVPLAGVGHFVHVEQPKVVADLVLEFLPDPVTGAPGLAGDVRHTAGTGSGLVTGRLLPGPDADTEPDRLVPNSVAAPITPVTPASGGRAGWVDAEASVPVTVAGSTGAGAAVAAGAVDTVWLRHNRVGLALHRLRDGGGDAGGRPMLLLHGLGERSPAAVPSYLDRWSGPVWALDFTGHGGSTTPAGGGYFAEVLMADVDIALAHLGPVTLFGRGLGAYVALLVAGARPDLVRGAILDDGPGLSGGGDEPGTSYIQTEPLVASGPPDPFALLELSRDVRPPDYAATFARLAATLSGLDVALAVVSSVRPPWLETVTHEPGVQLMRRDQAIALFATVDPDPDPEIAADAVAEPPHLPRSRQD